MGKGKWEMGDRQSATGHGKSGGMAVGSRATRADSAGDEPRYQQLDAWRFADDLAVDIYGVTKMLPVNARVLASQILRAAVSAPANIAEGYGRASAKEFQQFLVVAHASLYEVGYFLHFLKRIEAIDRDTLERLASNCQRTSRIVYGLMKSVRSGANANGRRYLRDEPGA